MRSTKYCIIWVPRSVPAITMQLSHTICCRGGHSDIEYKQGTKVEWEAFLPRERSMGWECYGVGCSGLLPLHCRKLITSSWNLVENFDAQQIFILIFPKISHWKIGVSSVRAVWRPVVPHQSLPCLNIDTYLAPSARNFFILELTEISVKNEPNFGLRKV